MNNNHGTLVDQDLNAQWKNPSIICSTVNCSSRQLYKTTEENYCPYEAFVNFICI